MQPKIKINKINKLKKKKKDESGLAQGSLNLVLADPEKMHFHVSFQAGHSQHKEFAYQYQLVDRSYPGPRVLLDTETGIVPFKHRE